MGGARALCMHVGWVDAGVGAGRAKACMQLNGLASLGTPHMLV